MTPEEKYRSCRDEKCKSLNTPILCSYCKNYKSGEKTGFSDRPDLIEKIKENRAMKYGGFGIGPIVFIKDISTCEDFQKEYSQRQRIERLVQENFRTRRGLLLNTEGLTIIEHFRTCTNEKCVKIREQLEEAMAERGILTPESEETLRKDPRYVALDRR